MTNYAVGDKASVTHTFSAGEVEAFAALTSDNNPIHLDEGYAKSSLFGRRVVHGMFTVSLFSRIFGTQYPGAGGIYLMQNCRFLKPVFIGDTVKAEIELVDFEGQKMIGTFNTTIYNLAGEVVVSGQAKVKLP